MVFIAVLAPASITPIIGILKISFNSFKARAVAVLQATTIALTSFSNKNSTISFEYRIINSFVFSP